MRDAIYHGVRALSWAAVVASAVLCLWWTLAAVVWVQDRRWVSAVSAALFVLLVAWRGWDLLWAIRRTAL
jgi:hypothetical protein